MFELNPEIKNCVFYQLSQPGAPDYFFKFASLSDHLHKFNIKSYSIQYHINVN